MDLMQHKTRGVFLLLFLELLNLFTNSFDHLFILSLVDALAYRLQQPEAVPITYYFFCNYYFFHLFSPLPSSLQYSSVNQRCEKFSLFVPYNVNLLFLIVSFFLYFYINLYFSI